MKANTPASAWLGGAALAIGLAGCGMPPQPVPVDRAPAVVQEQFPEDYYRQLEAAGRTVWRLDPAASQVVAEVGRAGALAYLGHDHVVAAHALRGYVAPEEGRADLVVMLDSLVVDEPALREAAGLSSRPTAEAVAGTRRNMLDKVLEAGLFPLVLVRVARGAPDSPALAVTVTLHGKRREFAVPARLEALPDGLRASGRMRLRQSDFAIVPLAVLGGALQVRDEVDLRFDIVARRP